MGNDVINPDRTLTLSPGPKLGNPSAVVLSPALNVRFDISNESPSGEIGNAALDPAEVESMQADLERNPPAKFDITRRLQVFSSRVVYVEFEIAGFALSRKQVPLPEDFSTVSDANLQSQISSRLRAPMAAVGAVEVKIGEGKDAKTALVDDVWLRKERKRIEDLYTFQIDNFGRVILREDRKDFDAAVQTFLTVVERYHDEVRTALDSHRAAFRKSFVAEFLPKWRETPPDYMTRWRNRLDDDSLRAELENRANEVFETMLAFEPPSVRLVEKNVSPSNVEDPRFLSRLRTIMERRRVPKSIIDSLFSAGEAAPEQGELLQSL